MDARQRYIETLKFANPERVPFQPGGPRESTLARWREEGLPEDRSWFEVLCGQLSIEPGGKEQRVWPGVDFRMRPRFEEKVLEHRGGHYVVQDWMGNITEISDDYDYTYIRRARDFVTRRWIKFPVEGRDDWERMKERYDPDDPGRYPDDFPERVRQLRERDYVCSLNFPGPWWQMREWCGFEPLCLMLMDDPELVAEMAEFWTEFVSRTMARALEAGVIDRIGISEDMAFKQRPMISPEAAGRLLQPAWSRWAAEAHQSGVAIVDMDSDGRIDSLVPLWIESGIDACDPLEVAAGNDIVSMRKRFGYRMAYRMGVDKRCIAAGGETIEKELRRVEPVVGDGGYIPGCDHGVPPDVSWPDFLHYSRLLAALTGWI